MYPSCIVRLEHHVIISTTVSGLVFWASRSWPATVASLATGILLDADHVLDYFREFGLRLNLRELFHASYERTFKRPFLILHAWEWMPLLAAVVWASGVNGWALGIAIGWFQHLLADQLANTPNKWAYSILWRRRHGFDHKVAFPPHER